MIVNVFVCKLKIAFQLNCLRREKKNFEKGIFAVTWDETLYNSIRTVKSTETLKHTSND